MRRAQSISCMTQLQAKAAVTDQELGGHFTRRCAAAAMSAQNPNVQFMVPKGRRNLTPVANKLLCFPY